MLLGSRETHVETVTNMIFKSVEEEFNEVVNASGIKYELDQSISGHYRLVVYREDEWVNGQPTYDIIHEDSACEDLYDKENAMAIFIYDIRERHNL